jgi:hypothetical protein
MDPDSPDQVDPRDQRSTLRSSGDNDPANDPMAPPKEPCECWCLHCGRTFMSDQMWFQRVIGDPQGFPGFWMCPTPNCDGAGFTFDIFPTDPDHPANEGWHSCDDDEEDEEYDDTEPELDADEEDDDDDAAEAATAEWDPSEPKYQQLDEQYGDAEDDDDLEGEEWKHGLQPGERPPESPAQAEARKQREAEERKYDEPDQRPREVDWSDRTDRDAPSLNEDDIPF